MMESLYTVTVTVTGVVLACSKAEAACFAEDILSESQRDVHAVPTIELPHGWDKTFLVYHRDQRAEDLTVAEAQKRTAEDQP